MEHTELVVCETLGSDARRVALLSLNRRPQRNALSDALMDAVARELRTLDADPAIGCIVLTGDERAFAAGADITEMQSLTFEAAYTEDFIGRNWEVLTTVRKPVIAAVRGIALGGGCELALMCDLIVAADTARFGLPEVTLGVMPGAGGTQRLPRLIGRVRALDMLLTNRWIDAAEAERWGLVSRVVPDEQLLPSAIAMAQAICRHHPLAVAAIKEAVQVSGETPLAAGMRFERRLFHALFGTSAQRDGMAAFLNAKGGGGPRST